VDDGGDGDGEKRAFLRAEREKVRLVGATTIMYLLVRSFPEFLGQVLARKIAARLGRVDSVLPQSSPKAKVASRSGD